MSARAKLALSYAAVVVLAGGLLLAVVWVFLLRYVPENTSAAIGWMPNRGDLLRAFAPKAALALVGLLVAGLAGGWLLAGRMLAPLGRIGAAAKLATQGSLSHRVELEGARDEFTELADVFDDMLARLEAHVAEQERFAANASHELRTPLAVTRTLLDVARKDPDRDIDLLLSRLDAVNGRAIELADALLLLSRTSRGITSAEEVDLSLVAEEAAENLLPLAEQRGISLDVSGTAAAVRGSEILLVQLATNLLHNAIVHNLPGTGTVSVRTSQHDGRALLVVENSGPRLLPDAIPTLIEPFQRGAGRVREFGLGDHAGTGLGLAIASNIVRAHGGALRLESRESGGLRVTAALPG